MVASTVSKGDASSEVVSTIELQVAGANTPLEVGLLLSIVIIAAERHFSMSDRIHISHNSVA